MPTMFARLIPPLVAAGMMVGGSAAADENIALRGGETVDLGSLYWVQDCRSLLKGTPSFEVMEGPAELSVSVKSQKVVPRKFNCAKPVDGAELFLTANDDIKARLEGKIVIRLKYPTRDGERQNSREINYTLYPKKQ